MDKTTPENKVILGTSENQYEPKYTLLLSRIVLLLLLGHVLKIDRSTYEILQILGILLLDKTPVLELFTSIDYKDVKELNCKQLSLCLL